MARLVKAEAELAEVDSMLQSAPGVGPIVSAALIAELPELGNLNRRATAALAGLAPVARDGGTRSGSRSIEGGRPVVRMLLYLATARKLLVTLNAMLAHREKCDPQ
jgi:transposase